MGAKDGAQLLRGGSASMPRSVASVGIQPITNGQRIAISIGDVVSLQQSPANFWADIRKDSDIAEFMLIVTTFKFKPDGR